MSSSCLQGLLVHGMRTVKAHGLTSQAARRRYSLAIAIAREGKLKVADIA
jgi:hypothetical protein